MNKLALLALLTMLLTFLAACGGTNTTNTMDASTFSTASVSIKAGDTLTFTDDAKTGSMHLLVIGVNGTSQSETGSPDFGTQMAWL